MLKRLRGIKVRVLSETTAIGLHPTPLNSQEYECATNVMFQFDSAARAATFAAQTGGVVAGNTGRHTYNEWDPILDHLGAHHPALDPFNLPQNKECRMAYSKDMLPRSLDILSRTVMIGLQPDLSTHKVNKLIRKICEAAKTVVEKESVGV